VEPPVEPKRERKLIPGPDCTEENSITIEAEPICLDCHERREAE